MNDLTIRVEDLLDKHGVPPELIRRVADILFAWETTGEIEFSESDIAVIQGRACLLWDGEHRMPRDNEPLDF